MKKRRSALIAKCAAAIGILGNRAIGSRESGLILSNGSRSVSEMSKCIRDIKVLIRTGAVIVIYYN